MAPLLWFVSISISPEAFNVASTSSTSSRVRCSALSDCLVNSPPSTMCPIFSFEGFSYPLFAHHLKTTSKKKHYELIDRDLYD
jgi:hypothetical protein